MQSNGDIRQFGPEKLVYEFITREVPQLLNTIILDDELKDWTLYFSFNYRNLESIVIYRNIRSAPKEKYKEIFISIPIPSRDEIYWGISPENHRSPKSNIIKKNTNYLPITLEDFDNRKDYIMDCVRRSVRYVLETGFKINGILIKLDKVVFSDET